MAAVPGNTHPVVAFSVPSETSGTCNGLRGRVAAPVHFPARLGGMKPLQKSSGAPKKALQASFEKLKESLTSVKGMLHLLHVFRLRSFSTIAYGNAGPYDRSIECCVLLYTHLELSSTF